MTEEYKIHIITTKRHNIDERVLDNTTIEFSDMKDVIAWFNKAGVKFQ